MDDPTRGSRAAQTASASAGPTGARTTATLGADGRGATR